MVCSYTYMAKCAITYLARHNGSTVVEQTIHSEKSISLFPSFQIHETEIFSLIDEARQLAQKRCWIIVSLRLRKLLLTTVKQRKLLISLLTTLNQQKLVILLLKTVKHYRLLMLLLTRLTNGDYWRCCWRQFFPFKHLCNVFEVLRSLL